MGVRQPESAALAATPDDAVAAPPPSAPPVVRAPIYYGGIASSMAACFTHPLDLVKVRMQVQGKAVPRIGPIATGVSVVKNEGVLGLYAGISASLLRQMTYSLTRFAAYDEVSRRLPKQENGQLGFGSKLLAGVVGGLAGGCVGAPADLANVRMQSDGKQPPELRRNYKHALDALIRIAREEGVVSLWKGAGPFLVRGSLMTLGQVSFYDQFKSLLIGVGMSDNVVTHFCSSIGSGFVATALTMPVDVVKTRRMNARPGEYRSSFDCAIKTLAEGPSTFFKGFIPAFVRLGPHTILTFIFLEQLRALHARRHAQTHVEQ